MSDLNHGNLISERSSLQRLLDASPADAVIDRAHLEARLDELAAEIAESAASQAEAEAGSGAERAPTQTLTPTATQARIDQVVRERGIQAKITVHPVHDGHVGIQGTMSAADMRAVASVVDVTDRKDARRGCDPTPCGCETHSNQNQTSPRHEG